MTEKQTSKEETSSEQTPKEPTSSEQKSKEPTSSEQKSKEPTPSEQKSNPSIMDKAKKELDSSVPVVSDVAERGKEFLTWAFQDYFDWNLRYFQQYRGILNAAEVILSMLIMAMLSNACKNQPFVDTEYIGFYCKAADTFLFAISTSAFLGSLLLLLCCVLSKKSETRLWSTSYEVSFYIFYSFFYFWAGVNLTSNVINRNKGKYEGEDFYNTTLAAGVFGIFAFILYGVSAAWFFIYHKKTDKKGGSNA